MSRARDSIDADEQHFVTIDELLLPILKAFVQRSSSLDAIRNA
jgi:hypothetical protein